MIKNGSLAFFLLLMSNLVAQESIWFNYIDHRLNRSVDGLSDEMQDRWMLGRSFFVIPWVVAPSATTARDGLGPLFNANTCASCHRGNGVGERFNGQGKLSRAIVTKLSRTSGQQIPFYGHQIAVNGLMQVPFEALPTRSEEKVTVRYPDGRTVELTKPTYGLTALQYGNLPDDLIIAQYRAPALVGLGLLSRVSTADILSRADPDDRNRDGISGRPNWVVDQFGKKRLGRFTIKASMPTVVAQVANAAANDMGLTNPLFPDENCEPEQTACREAPRGRPAYDGETLDLTQSRLSAMTYYLNTSQVPVRPLSHKAKEGRAIFNDIGCASCHLPKMTTSDGVSFSPYTDLLLHDMGKELADHREDGLATGQEFRTAPLWGLSTYGHTLKSKKPYYLHDARAETIEAAILWHGGEAQKSQEAFMQLSAEKRDALIEFLSAL